MTISRPQFTAIFFLGPPGSGKDYQADRLVRKYADAAKISPSSLITEKNLQKQGLSEATISQIIAMKHAGERVPDEYVNPLVLGAIQQALKEGKRHLFFAGYLRHLDQFNAFQRLVGENNLSIQQVVVGLGVSEQTAEKRMQKRFKKEKREDDTDIEKMRRRRKVFMENNMPVIDLLKEKMQGLRREVRATIPIFEINAGYRKWRVNREVNKVLAPYLPPREPRLERVRHWVDERAPHWMHRRKER